MAGEVGGGEGGAASEVEFDGAPDEPVNAVGGFRAVGSVPRRHLLFELGEVADVVYPALLISLRHRLGAGALPLRGVDEVDADGLRSPAALGVEGFGGLLDHELHHLAALVLLGHHAVRAEAVVEPHGAAPPLGRGVRARLVGEDVAVAVGRAPDGADAGVVARGLAGRCRVY